jgi:hypothetical protein
MAKKFLYFRESGNYCTKRSFTFDAFFIIQDINIASNVSRVLAARDVNAKGRSIFVTALAAAKERLPRYKLKFSNKSVFLAKEYMYLGHFFA